MFKYFTIFSWWISILAPRVSILQSIGPLFGVSTLESVALLSKPQASVIFLKVFVPVRLPVG